jgi:ubiquinone biosynthesis protein COQ4
MPFKNAAPIAATGYCYISIVIAFAGRRTHYRVNKPKFGIRSSAMNEVPYLLRGVKRVTTDSSVLISSSKYLNHPRMREWMSTIALKRNGPDIPAQSEMYEVISIIYELQNNDEIDDMLTQERKVNPILDEWFHTWEPIDSSAENLKTMPEGSLGQIFYRDILQSGYETEIFKRPPPVTQYEIFKHQIGPLHDFEHILTGGDFNYMGELVPGWARLTSFFKHFKNPKLAGELILVVWCGLLRYQIRTLFNYPEVWPVAQNSIERGMRVGRESGPYFLGRVQDVLHLPLAEARKALDIHGAEYVDTTAASMFWSERAELPA